jgi:AcrR family transcriptional regulator
MDAIAEEAGVSKPTLYQYFASKEALLFAAMMDTARDAHAGTVRAAIGRHGRATAPILPGPMPIR